MTAAAAHARFTFAFHHTLNPGGGELVWSPYSLASGLGLAASGACGPTRDEIAGFLAPGAGPGGPDKLSETGELLARAAGLDPDRGTRSVLAVANTLWTRPDLAVRPGYERALAAWPGAGVHAADFATDPDGARQAINSHVDKATRGHISELLERGTVTRATLAVLVNALWLRLVWTEPFRVDRTRPRPFHTPGGTREVATMTRRARLAHATTGGWQLVSLPGEGGLTVDFCLPDAPLAALDAGTYAALRGRTRSTDVELYLPRFSLRNTAELDGPLRGHGVRQLFTDAADLSGISPTPLKVDKVVHAATLDVDETGAEGSAATALLMTPGSVPVPSEPTVVRLDRPFYAVVRHDATGAIYFLAHVTHPRETSTYRD